MLFRLLWDAEFIFSNGGRVLHPTAEDSDRIAGHETEGGRARISDERRPGSVRATSSESSEVT